MDDEIEETVVLSGYSLSPASFRSLVRSLSIIRDSKPHRRHFMDYVLAYDIWHRKLPSDIASKTPEVICIYDEESSNENPTSHFFFTRCVPFDEDKQLDPEGDYSDLWHPTQKDENRLAAFQKLVESYGGQLKLEKLQFGCLKRDMYVSKSKWRELNRISRSTTRIE